MVWGAIVRNPSVSVRSEVAEYLMLRNSLLLVRDHFGRYPAFIRFCFGLVNTTRDPGAPPRGTWALLLVARPEAGAAGLPSSPPRPAAARARGRPWFGRAPGQGIAARIR